MPAVPEIVTRAGQPYVAVRTRVTMAGLGGLGAGFAEVLAWLGARGVSPAGAPFFRYNVVDMAGELEVDAGVPVAHATEAGGHLVAGVLPAGRYAALTHTGDPAGLVEAAKVLLDWAAGQDLKWDMAAGDNGERWGCRLEIYLTDPRQQPDPAKWETQLAFRLK